MALYMIGDIQGCYGPLQRLLTAIDFSPSRDTIYCLGDLVNRGPDSLAVLRYLRALEGAAVCLLGNHDLHLLAVAHGFGKLKKRDTLNELLAAHDAPMLLNWLQHRPLAAQAKGWLMVHAGVFPEWTAEQTLSLAAEVQEVLASPSAERFFAQMYGNTPAAWADELIGIARWRAIVNALTRIRLVNAKGEMDFDIKGDASKAPADLMPWFAHPKRRTQGQPVAFGHWSTLGTQARRDALPLDTGCVWGGTLTAARITERPGEVEIIRQPCPQAQKPG